MEGEGKPDKKLTSKITHNIFYEELYFYLVNDDSEKQKENVNIKIIGIYFDKAYEDHFVA